MGRQGQCEYVSNESSAHTLESDAFVLSKDTNKTNYQCKTIECACVADRFLCGQDGSVSKYLTRLSSISV